MFRLFRFSRLVLLIAALGILFVATGYLLSDSFFFRRVVRQNHLNTPEDVYTFVRTNTGKLTPSHFPTDDYIPPDASPGTGLGLIPLGAEPPLEYWPREMLTKQKYLWCDQKVSLMATLVRRLNYKTRIVDFVGDDGMSHHTILEVFQDGHWKTYDPFYETQGATYAEITRGWTKPLRPVYRQYIGPSWPVRYNFYLKKASIWRHRILQQPDNASANPQVADLSVPDKH